MVNLKIGKHRVITNKSYVDLINIRKLWNEREGIIKDNKIQLEKEKLQRKYKKYIGKWFTHKDDGTIFQIHGIYYSSGWYPRFQFSTYVPNWDDGFEVDIDDITEKKHEEVKNPARMLGSL